MTSLVGWGWEWWGVEHEEEVSGHTWLVYRPFQLIERASDLNLNHLPSKALLCLPFSSLSILREGRSVSSYCMPRPQGSWSQEAGPLKPLAVKPPEVKLGPPHTVLDQKDVIFM